MTVNKAFVNELYNSRQLLKLLHWMARAHMFELDTNTKCLIKQNTKGSKDFLD